MIETKNVPTINKLKSLFVTNEINGQLKVLNIHSKTGFHCNWYRKEYTGKQVDVLLLERNSNTYLRVHNHCAGNLTRVLNFQLLKHTNPLRLPSTRIYTIESVGRKRTFKRVLFEREDLFLFAVANWYTYQMTLGRFGDLPLKVVDLVDPQADERLLIKSFLGGCHEE